MDGTNKKAAIQWHPTFFAGIQIEFEADKENLIFENEHQLGKKPFGIDILIIKKDKALPVQKNIGKIFRKHNILEYKSPDDYLSIDDYYKAFAYAYFYKADTGRVDEIKISDVTVTLICHKHPYKLIKYLKEQCRDEIRKYEDGIYRVTGERIPMQIIVTSRLSAEKNLWLKCLGNPVKDLRTREKLAAAYKKNRKNSLYEAAMEMIVQVNNNEFKEGIDVCQALVDLVEEVMGERMAAERARMRAEVKAEVKTEVEAEVKAEVKAEMEAEIKAEMKAKAEAEVKAEMKAKAEAEVVAEVKANGKAETILDFLVDYGDVPDSLRTRILAEHDFETLRRWVKIAGHAASVDEFQKAM